MHTEPTIHFDLTGQEFRALILALGEIPTARNVWPLYHKLMSLAAEQDGTDEGH